MEEEKAAAYYEELTRKGGGAARFKQGLGFSSATTTSDDPPSRGSALASSSSFLSNFVRASSPTKEKEVDKRTRLENIQNKLKKKEPTSSIEAPSEKARVGDRDRRRSRSRDREIRSNRSRSRSRERRRRRSGGGSDEDSDRSRRRYRSSSRDRRRKRNREGRSRRRSRSRSYSDGDRRYGRNKGRSRSRSRSSSPRHRRKSERGKEVDGKERRTVKKMGNDSVDYAKLIDGYDNMTPAERVKAKMKLQLTQTAEKDTKIGSGSQWERFDFDKDAPVDDKEIEAADDDIALVKHIGQSFRFTSLEAKRDDEIKNAHDEAMFGVPAPIRSYTLENGEEGGSENENENKESTNDDDPASSLISEKVLWQQQGSWRDRARRKVG